MNFIAGYLILITKNEEESFWLLDALVGKILPGRLKVLFTLPAQPLPALPCPASGLFERFDWPSQDGVKCLGCNSGIERFLTFIRQGLGFNLTLEREKGEKNVVKTDFVEAALREKWVCVLSV